MPAGATEGSEVALVAKDVAFSFFLPEFSPRRRDNSAISAIVHMPETAVDKDDFFVPDKDNIRMAGEVRAMQGITITHSMNDRTDN